MLILSQTISALAYGQLYQQPNAPPTKGHAVYTIDLATLLQLLSEFQRSGTLQAEVPAGLPGLKQPCVVVVELLAGKMISCYVKDDKGRSLLVDQGASQIIFAAGKLNWVFRAGSNLDTLDREQFPNSSLPRSVRTSPLNTGPLGNSGPLISSGGPNTEVPPYFSRSSPIPKHVFRLSTAQINAWPRRYRQIYVLIDGTRNVERIAAILSQSPQAVEEALLAMQSTGAIRLER